MSLVDEYLSTLNDLQRARIARAPLSSEEELECLEKLGDIWEHLTTDERATVELVVQAGE